MKQTLVYLTFLLILFSSPTFAKHCKKGQPCGNSCISWKYTCHKSSSSSSSTYHSNRSKVQELGAPIEYMYVTANELNVRSKPNLNSRIVGTLYKGEWVRTRKSTLVGWRTVYYGGSYFWASSKYLSYKKP